MSLLFFRLQQWRQWRKSTTPAKTLKVLFIGYNFLAQKLNSYFNISRKNWAIKSGEGSVRHLLLHQCRGERFKRFLVQFKAYLFSHQMMRNKAKSFCQSLGMQLAALESAPKISNIIDSIENGARDWICEKRIWKIHNLIFSWAPQYFVVVRDQQRPRVPRVPLGGRRGGGRRFVGAQRAQHVRSGGLGVRGHDEGWQTGGLRLRNQKQTALPTACRGRTVLLVINYWRSAWSIYAIKFVFWLKRRELLFQRPNSRGVGADKNYHVNIWVGMGFLDYCMFCYWHVWFK